MKFRYKSIKLKDGSKQVAIHMLIFKNSTDIKGSIKYLQKLLEGVEGKNNKQ